MRARVLRSVLCTAAAAAFATAAVGAELTALPAPSGAGADRGVALLRCALANDHFWLSRSAVLNVGPTPAADVLLTTAHGLPRDEQSVLRQCRIIAYGKPYAIRAVWRSQGHGHADDWAVLVSRRLQGEIQRLRAGIATPELLAEMAHSAAPIRLVLRYADGARSDCRLERRALVVWPLVRHSCLSYPGSSGSPLVVGVGGEPLVIGLHVGSTIEFDGSRLDFGGIGRAVDAEIGAAIAEAAAHAAKRRR